MYYAAGEAGAVRNHCGKEILKWRFTHSHPISFPRTCGNGYQEKTPSAYNMRVILPKDNLSCQQLNKIFNHILMYYAISATFYFSKTNFRFIVIHKCLLDTSVWHHDRYY